MEEIIHLYHLSFVADYESIRFERKRSDQIQIVLNFLTFFLPQRRRYNIIKLICHGIYFCDKLVMNFPILFSGLKNENGISFIQ